MLAFAVARFESEPTTTVAMSAGCPLTCRWMLTVCGCHASSTERLPAGTGSDALEGFTAPARFECEARLRSGVGEREFGCERDRERSVNDNRRLRERSAELCDSAQQSRSESTQSSQFPYVSIVIVVASASTMIAASAASARRLTEIAR